MVIKPPKKQKLTKVQPHFYYFLAIFSIMCHSLATLRVIFVMKTKNYDAIS